jgi:chromosome segregation ATPase
MVKEAVEELRGAHGCSFTEEKTMNNDELLAALKEQNQVQLDEHRKGLEEFIHGYFRKVDARFDDVDRRLDELTTRTSQTDQSIVGLRRDITQLHEIAATQGARMDSIDSRLSRINRRLDLTDKADALEVRVQALEKAVKP